MGYDSKLDINRKSDWTIGLDMIKKNDDINISIDKVGGLKQKIKGLRMSSLNNSGYTTMRPAIGLSNQSQKKPSKF